LNPVAFLSAAVHGDTLFAGSYQFDVSYRSTNGGETWSKNLETDFVSQIVIKSNTVYAADQRRVFRSEDFGETWLSSSSILPAVTRLAIGDTLLFAATNLGVYRSTNGGNDWDLFSTGLPSVFGSYTIHDIRIISGSVYAATENGVYKSTNSGVSWFASNNGMPIDWRGVYPRINVLWATENKLFAGTDGAGVYRTSNGGTTWVATSTGLPQMPVYSAAVADGRIFLGLDGGGIYVSTDNGEHWYQGIRRLPAIAYVFGFAVRGTALFAATFNGIFRSTDVDSIWIPVFTRFPKILQTSVLTATTNNLIASGLSSSWNGGIGGAFYSTNSGIEWTSIDSLSPARYFTCFAVHNNSVFGGNWYGIYHSSDEGIHWSSDSSSPGTVNAILSKGSDLYAATGYYHWQLGEFGCVYRSTDNGSTWIAAGLVDTTILSLAYVENYLFAGTLRTIYRTSDSGLTWLYAGDGLPANTAVKSFEKISEHLFASTPRGIYRSSDFGTNWVAVNSGLPVDSISRTSLATYMGNLFVGTNRGIYLSTDMGTNWIPINAGLNNDALYVYAVAAHGSDLFVGTRNGVWRRPLTQIITSLPTSQPEMTSFRLEQNYPNPFNPETRIRYELPKESKVLLKVYNNLGQEVVTLVNDLQKAGRYEVEYTAAKFATGVYFYRLQAGEFVETKKLVLMK
jgi:photosystem II stability/assembly factor-like uncharacterized protein